MQPKPTFNSGDNSGDVVVSGIRPPFEFSRAGDLQIRHAHWLVRPLLELDSLALLFGDPGSCKSFVALDLAACVATGTDFHGHKVQQGAAFVIVGEGYNGIMRRLGAWEIARGVSLKDAPLYVSRTPAAFCDPVSTNDVAAAIRRIATDTGTTPTLIVIDTVARNFGPGDENSTQHMGAFIAAMDALRGEWGAAVLAVHHTGHADKSRARGAMALKGALDFEYRSEKDENGIIRIECTKPKDHERPQPLAFRLAPVDLAMVDDEGEPVMSAVLTPCVYVELPKTGKVGRGKHQTRAMQLLGDLYEEHRDRLEQTGNDSNRARVLLDDWRQRCIADGIHHKRWTEVWQSLRDAGRIKVENGYVYAL